MKNGITEMVFILDRSGSMSGLEADTIGGFNSLIEKQKRQEGKCYISTVLFDDVSTVLYDRVELEKIRPMTNDDYVPRGCTALIDAIGGAVHHIGNVHKYIRTEDVPENTVFVIITDGCENASIKYTADTVKAMIEEKKREFGWEFMFIGANIDSVTTAGRFGISGSRAVDYKADSTGTCVAYGAVAETLKNFRASKPISDDWKDGIAADMKKRGGKNSEECKESF